MSLSHLIRKPLVCLLATAVLSLSLPVAPASAGLASTESVLTPSQAQQDRHHLGALLAREDVKQQLMAYGVQPDAVQARVASLTDREVQMLVDNLGELPAGGNGVGAVLGVALVVFLVLLFTDILGWTSVFPFTKKGAVGR